MNFSLIKNILSSSIELIENQFLKPWSDPSDQTQRTGIIALAVLATFVVPVATFLAFRHWKVEKGVEKTPDPTAEQYLQEAGEESLHYESRKAAEEAGAHDAEKKAAEASGVSKIEERFAPSALPIPAPRQEVYSAPKEDEWTEEDWSREKQVVAEAVAIMSRAGNKGKTPPEEWVHIALAKDEFLAATKAGDENAVREIVRKLYKKSVECFKRMREDQKRNAERLM